VRIKSIFRTLSIASPVVMICGVLVSAAFANDASENEKRTCSDQMFLGDYGFTIEGVILPPSAPSFPIRGLQMIHSDGKGNLTGVEHLVIDGQPPDDWASIRGTYHLNPDCTGTAYLENMVLNTFVNLRMVLVKQGKEIRTVVTAPFDSGIPRDITTIGVKVDDSPR
jgi:hypothetical protein